MYFYLILCHLLSLIHAFLIRQRDVVHSPIESKELYTYPLISRKIIKYFPVIYSNLDEDGKDVEEEDIADSGKTESFCDTTNDLEMMEFTHSVDKDGKILTKNLKISRRLWKVLMGLLVYRSKYKNYNIGYDFVFDKDDENNRQVAGYPLGDILNNLLDLVDLRGKDPALFTRYNETLQAENKHFPLSDVKEAPKLLWLLGFPTPMYLKRRKKLDSVFLPTKSLTTKLRKWDLLKPLKHATLYDGIEDNSAVLERTNRAKKLIIEFLKDQRKHLLDQLFFKNPQKLPEPSNKAVPREKILKTIVSEILEKHKASNVCPLIQRDTRSETEGGYHYAFYHWSFEQVVQCLVLFNDMYFDYNRELLISCERSGEQFEPITFNMLNISWRVPEDDNWPQEFHGMPLGYFIERFRNGDIDAKEHWLRRSILDHIGFNWGDGIKYLTFTWDKLERGLIWFVNFRGCPIIDMKPYMEIPKTTLVAKFARPEEVQGLKLGKLVYTAIDQIQVLRAHYPERYKFIAGMGLDMGWKEQVCLGYKPVPHSKFVTVNEDLQVSTDKKHLFDKTNPPPKSMKKEDVVRALDIINENLTKHKDERYLPPRDGPPQDNPYHTT